MRDAREPARALAGDVVEVRRLAADHRAERDDTVIAAIAEQQHRCQRNLVRTRRTMLHDVRHRHAPVLEAGARTGKQCVDDADVPARRQQRHARGGEVLRLRRLG